MLDIKTLSDNNKNLDLCKARSLLLTYDNMINEEYLKLYLLYKNIFEIYLWNKLNFRKYNNIFSSLSLVSIKEEKKDFYQKYSKYLGEFFYLRNNLYIENLSEEELKFLKMLVPNSNLETEEIMMFVQNTYLKVIRESINENEYYQFGIFSSQFFVKNETIVVGFSYENFYEEVGHEFNEKKYLENRNCVQQQLKEINQELLENNCIVLEYINN